MRQKRMFAIWPTMHEYVAILLCMRRALRSPSLTCPPFGTPLAMIAWFGADFQTRVLERAGTSQASEFRCGLEPAP